MAGSGDFGEAWRARLWEAQGGICFLCGKQMPEPPINMASIPAALRLVSLDHVYPRARQRWRGNTGNMLLAHEQCNSRKDERMPYPCEVLFLTAINDRLGVRLAMFDGDRPNHNRIVPTPEERASQSARDKAAHRERMIGRQSATVADVWPVAPTRAQMAERHPALGAFDHFIEGYRDLHKGPDL